MKDIRTNQQKLDDIDVSHKTEMKHKTTFYWKADQEVNIMPSMQNIISKSGS